MNDTVSMDVVASIGWALAFLLTIELIRAMFQSSTVLRRFVQKKPLSCDVCMSSWFTIFLGLLDRAYLGVYMAAGGLCLLLLIVFVTPRRGPPDWEE